MKNGGDGEDEYQGMIYVTATFKILQCNRDEEHINPVSPNSDQHQFSPNNIHRLSSATSMRINQMITKRKISDLLSISPN